MPFYVQPRKNEKEMPKMFWTEFYRETRKIQRVEYKRKEIVTPIPARCLRCAIIYRFTEARKSIAILFTGKARKKVED